MKDFLKKIIPQRLWVFVRTHRAWFIDVATNIGASECKRAYQGFTVYYNPGNALVDRLRKERYFEKDLCERIIGDLENSEQKVFLDIGANIGLMTLSVLARVQNTKVYAFEPGPMQAGFLEKTITENKLSEKVTLYRKALGESAGEATFFVHDGSDIAKDGFKNTGRGEGGHEITVSVETLDNWWKAAGEPKAVAVKIDTEGAELFVLKGGKEFLSTVKPVLYLEIEPSNLAAYPYAAADIVRFLNSVDYDVSTLDNVAVTPENIDGFTKQFDTYRAFPRAL
jgi:FkbM family methyltransferase